MPDGFLEKMLGPLPGTSGSVRWVGDPIRSHLALLLNTRRGTIKTLPDFGLPDMASYFSDYPASLAQLSHTVEELIRKYEPRLANVRVRLVETGADEFRVSFLITGEVAEGRDEVARVQYRTTITSTGQAQMGG